MEESKMASMASVIGGGGASSPSPPPPPPLSSSSSHKKGKGSKMKPKRVRRKCSHPSCDNRVVQGGVCVTHGARRKGCAHPGCEKAVKLAGYCSTHGPSRRKCDEVGCDRVAVQGGRCLSHGARRRVCNYPSRDGVTQCGKNAILGGMCKKHHDRMADARGMLDAVGLCVPCDVPSDGGGGASRVVGVPDAVRPGEDIGGGMVGGGGGVEGRGSYFPPSSYHPTAGAGDESAAVVVGGAFPYAEAPVDPRYDGYHRPADRQWNYHEQQQNNHPQYQDHGAFQDEHRAAVLEGYHPQGVREGYYHRQSLPPPPPPQPQPVVDPRPPKRARHHTKSKGHTRGLSIFEEMSTVDAIISSGKSENRHASSSSLSSSSRQPQSDRRRDVQPYRSSPKTEFANSTWSYSAPSSSNDNDAMSVPTKTPAAQVSFADSCFKVSDGRRRGGEPRSSLGGGGRNGGDSPPCAGNSSCTCTACRSPTLAIFEQMIQASQKIEKGEVDPAKYAGLSPPRLSPRRTTTTTTTAAAAAVSAERPDQNLRPDQPIVAGGTVVVGGSVIRKVSSNNIVGKALGVRLQEEDGGCHPPHDHDGPHHRSVPWETDMGPASHALAAADSPSHGEEDEASGVGRTISDDVDDGGLGGGGRYHHSQHVAMSSSLHPRQHPSLLRDFQPPPAHQLSSLPLTYDPTQGAPLTPKLLDGNDHPQLGGVVGSPLPRDASDPAMVSSHSSNSTTSLLPRMRESIEHLFIPKEV